MDDQQLQEAQRNLEQKRAAQPRPTAPSSLQDILPVILSTSQINGDFRAIAPDEWCDACPVRSTCRVDSVECKRQAEESKSRRRVKVSASLQSVNIGARYQGMSFADFDTAGAGSQKVLTICSRYAETFPDRLKNCDNLLMLGNPGTGKNMLAACICQSVATQGFSVIHTTAMKLIRKIKESWGKKAEISEQDAINQFSKPDLLVIDEVGVQYGSETEKILLFEVINERYEAMKPTIVISNLGTADVETFLGARIMDRFHEGKSAVLEFTWESYRRRK